MRITFESLDARRDELLGIARRRGATAVPVISSIARDESAPSSDIDFLVEFEPGRSLFDQVHRIDDLGAVLGTWVDVVDRGRLVDRDHHIVAEAVPQ